MPTVPTTLRFLWPSTNASIPANWVRDTAYDGYYLHAATGDTAGTTGGAATHNHTEGSHLHTFTGANSGSVGTTHANRLTFKTGTALTGHGHNSTNSNTTTATLQAVTNAPSYYEVIVIKPNDSSRVGVPNSAWALWDDSASSPASWTAQSGANSKLLKVAAAAGNGGGTGGGAMSHNHAENDHGHTAKDSAASNNNANYDIDGTDHASSVHVHSVELTAKTGLTTSTDTGFPAYDTLAIIQNGTGAEDLPSGVIGLYGGTIASIPADWTQKSLTSGADMIMGTGTLANIGTTGGTRTHGHTGPSHNHNYTAGDPSAARGNFDLGIATYAKYSTHTHTWTIGNAVPTVNDTAAREHYPTYIETILLQYAPSATTPRLLASTGAGT